MPSKCWKTRLKLSSTKRSRKIKFFHLISAKPFCKIVAQASCLPGLYLRISFFFAMPRALADWKSALRVRRAENRSAGILPAEIGLRENVLSNTPSSRRLEVCATLFHQNRLARLRKFARREFVEINPARPIARRKRYGMISRCEIAIHQRRHFSSTHIEHLQRHVTVH